MSDLQSLLASIRPRPSQPGSAAQEESAYALGTQPDVAGLFPPHPQHASPVHEAFHRAYQHPSVASLQSSSPIPTPPRNPADVISPNVGTPQSEWDAPQLEPTRDDRAVNLLNLLRFNQNGENANSPRPMAAFEQQDRSQPAEEASAHGRNISASDLVSSLLGPQASAARPIPPGPVASPPVSQEGPNENTQDMLLRLLNRPQSGASQMQASSPMQAASPMHAQKFSSELRSVSPMTSNGPKIQGITTSESLEATNATNQGTAKPETVVGQHTKDSMFTYVNPFDQLAAIFPSGSSPQTQFKPASDIQAPDNSLKQNVDVPADKPVSTSGNSAPGKRSKSPVLEAGQREAVNDVVSRFVNEIGRSMSDESKPVEEVEPVALTSREDSPDFMHSVAGEAIEILDEAIEQIEGRENDDSESTGPPQETAEAANVAAISRTVLETAEALADSWESAEDSAQKAEARIVTVQNFPLRPFISISLNPRPGKLATFSDDRIMDIARLKKDFDQLDRSLTAATPEYIVYALAKSGGLRIIRQDDGSDRQVFRSTRDRVFNVALSSSLAEADTPDMQAILGIGVSGAVYWALINRDDKDLFEMDALESESLIFPPFPASDENTSGGQLKTRAKRSSRHADMFGIGRGKNIYVIAPRAAMNASFGIAGAQRTVNTEKFFKERALKISTGKAGKDFAFSGDDTVIASLDKTGRLRFWDIRDVLDQPSLVEGPPPTEVKAPLCTFVTGSPTEKSWPTSVLFLDKLRPYSRSSALRYVLVGLKQNHTLQLWDIGLSRAVEEVKFPHENESDAICSVAYHPPSGIIVVGHPTRNSIYFVHLSAPRYNLPGMSQAAYIKATGDKESALPKPESTACMSGIREISLGSKGQLRSLELLSLENAVSEKPDTDNALFELYVMHSRGVTCLNITKDDMGWSSDNKVLNPIDAKTAVEEGWIEVVDLQAHPIYSGDEPSVNGEAGVSQKSSKEGGRKEALEKAQGTPRNQSPAKFSTKKKPEEQVETPVASGTEKSDKKKKKKSASDQTPKAREPVAGVAPLEGSHKIENLTSSLSFRPPVSTPPHPPIFPHEASYPASPAARDQLTNAFSIFLSQMSSIFEAKFAYLREQMDEDRHSLDSAATTRQDELLRLVSETLSTNVEETLHRIIEKCLDERVLPTLGDSVSQEVTLNIKKCLDERVLPTLGDSVSQEVTLGVAAELRDIISKSIPAVLEDPKIVSRLSTTIIGAFIPRLDNLINRAVSAAVQPTLETHTTMMRRMDAFVKESTASVQVRLAESEANNAELKAQISAMDSKITALLALVGKAGTPNEPAHVAVAAPPAPAPRGPAPPGPVPPAGPAPLRVSGFAYAPGATAPGSVAATQRPSPEDMELQEIVRLYETGHFEDAAVKWVQSRQQADLFDKFFVRVSPLYMRGLPAIVSLSVAVAATATLATNTNERLNWLEVVLDCVNPQDPEVQSVAPKIMEILGSRLHNLYLGVVSENPQDPILRRLAPLSRRVRALHN